MREISTTFGSRPMPVSRPVQRTIDLPQCVGTATLLFIISSERAAGYGPLFPPRISSPHPEWRPQANGARARGDPLRGDADAICSSFIPASAQFLDVGASCRCRGAYGSNLRDSGWGRHSPPPLGG